MDIDFHFWATYTAARFADLNHERAIKIASSAQMVDENALGAIEAGVKKDAAGADMRAGPHYFRSIPIKEEAKDPPIIDYQIIQSFQTISGIAMSTNICYKAYWPVFHFLPGNFEPSHYPGELKGICDTFWRRREPRQNKDKNFLDHFPWLTRPYSPMAIQLINNCCGLVNDPTCDIGKYGLEDYLIGITMHVFIDTWAHQDFVGYTAYSINGINGKPRIDSHKVKRGIFNKQEEFAGTQDKLVIRRFGEEASTWLGHGPAGHWPDHSALKFTYTPNWSNTEITRDNPKEYMEAFVNMVEAIRCIVGNKKYYPITVYDAQRSGYKANLQEVEKLINFPRYQDGSGEQVSFGKGARRDNDLNRDWIETLTTVGFKRADPWDLNMYYFNAQWRNFILSVYDEAREIPDWIPGKSLWIAQAKDASKKNWITPEEFRKLDYFKFNVAAKFHFRSVQQQLKAFGQQLLGDWPAGFAYADDLAAIASVARSDEKKSQILFALRETQRTSKKVDDQEIITVLIRQVEDASYVNEARQILKNALDDHTIRGSLDAKTVDSLKKISGYQNVSVQLKFDGRQVHDADPDVNHFISIISSEVAINSFASSLKESVDDYLNKSKKADPKSVGVRRALSFKEELNKQSVYASDGSYTESDLGELIFNLFVNNRIGNQSFAGALGLGGSIQTNENSLFTCAVNALINNPLFFEASGGVARRISALPANRKLTMKSGYAAKGEGMSLRRLLFRLLDLPRKTNSTEKYTVSAKDSALLLHAVKSR